jgi:hypothetical protein
MWRLPVDDVQRQRCVKAATENLRAARDGTRRSIQVLDIYKIENRPLMHAFEAFTQQQPQSKVKGLFCAIPVESLEHCIVYGMHSNDVEFQQHANSTDSIYCRPSFKISHNQDVSDSARKFHARQQVANSPPLSFPRVFSRYSNLAADSEGNNATEDVQYLALCRVAMGKTLRVNTTATFPSDDESVGSIFIVADQSYIVRYPQAVVPEFVIEVTKYLY